MCHRHETWPLMPWTSNLEYVAECSCLDLSILRSEVGGQVPSETRFMAKRWIIHKLLGLRDGDSEFVLGKHPMRLPLRCSSTIDEENGTETRDEVSQVLQGI